MTIIKRMSFKWIDSSRNEKILSCFSNGRIVLRNERNAPYCLSNIMFNSGLQCGYDEEKNTLREALKNVVDDCSAENAIKTLEILKQKTNLFDWEIYEFDKNVFQKEQKKTQIKKMYFELKNSGTTYILKCFNNGNIFLENDSKVLIHLSNIMFNAGLNCGYVEEKNILESELKKIMNNYSEKNANATLAVLKKVTKLNGWKMLIS